MAAIVSAFGIRTSNGSPFCSTTCRKKIVIASEVLTPTFFSARSADAFNFGSAPGTQVKRCLLPLLLRRHRHWKAGDLELDRAQMAAAGEVERLPVVAAE